MSVILIIDDSPTELHLFQNMLEKNGFGTLVADSGEEGLRRAKVSRPDCILMDVVMPGMNGFEAKRTLARDEATAHIPVVFVTTQNDNVDRDWGMRQGAVDYMTKPVDAASLQAAIDAAIANQR